MTTRMGILAAITMVVIGSSPIPLVASAASTASWKAAMLR